MEGTTYCAYTITIYHIGVLNFSNRSGVPVEDEYIFQFHMLASLSPTVKAVAAVRHFVCQPLSSSTPRVALLRRVFVVVVI